MTHNELCERAILWLRGTRRCEPVFSRCASCSEIPDAIGWSSAYGWRGSTVVECKTSVGDFYADLRKAFLWKHPEHSLWTYPAGRISAKSALLQGYEKVRLPLMGNYRFYFCEDGVLPLYLIEEKAPDHGLIYKQGRRIKIVRPAPKREEQWWDKDAEIRFLRFTIINGKKPHKQEEFVTAQPSHAAEEEVRS